ncbi:DsbA family protein [Pseudonocardia sp. HH130630-07]|uniref:DsbA family protein n=1 Tax=Pseudonocardia sp. HH130630-07 TaxID=1690815 RepID=UPI00081528E2|nr:thioredoxin domain-containing protein [Pseudonocardia sp. HH130630-07]ANY05289.1 disulfide bond formation protein DsbA [Pseudonocardia sp. HH130630-07]
MTRNVKISLFVVGAFALLVAALLFATRPDAPSTGPGGAASPEALAPPEAARLNDNPGAPVKLVEFLDFQCPGCAQLQPFMSQLVAQYGDRVDFVVRDFPLEMHANSEPSAVAAEAAHRQGRFVAMYERLFQTQQNWAGSADAATVFRGYAQDLGLDMAAYDAAVADPATLDAVRADQAAGEAAGVGGTPAIFVNGELVEVDSVQDITDALDAAVAP